VKLVMHAEQGRAMFTTSPRGGHRAHDSSAPALSETVAMAAEAFEGTLTDLYLPRKASAAPTPIQGRPPASM
jgi:hypothetical protein